MYSNAADELKTAAEKQKRRGEVMKIKGKRILAAVCTAALMLSCMPVQAIGGAER